LQNNNKKIILPATELIDSRMEQGIKFVIKSVFLIALLCSCDACSHSIASWHSTISTKDADYWAGNEIQSILKTNETQVEKRIFVFQF